MPLIRHLKELTMTVRRRGAVELANGQLFVVAVCRFLSPSEMRFVALDLVMSYQHKRVCSSSQTVLSTTSTFSTPSVRADVSR